MKKLILLILLTPTLLFGANTQAFDKEGIPKRPSPKRFVNIIEGAPQVFTSEQKSQLESALIDILKNTGVQITLVVVPDLNGYEKAQMAEGICQKWGFGEKGKDKGIVFLLKPKTGNSKEYVFIAIGGGFEGIITDEIGERIVEVIMIPSFLEKDYLGGISKSIETLKSLALEEFSAKEYLSKTEGVSSLVTLLPILVLIIVFLVLRTRSGSRRNYSSSSIPFWKAMFLGGSVGRGSHGSWSEFSSSSAGIGGFGGGGAGGSW